MLLGHWLLRGLVISGVTINHQEAVGRACFAGHVIGGAASWGERSLIGGAGRTVAAGQERSLIGGAGRTPVAVGEERSLIGGAGRTPAPVAVGEERSLIGGSDRTDREVPDWRSRRMS